MTAGIIPALAGNTLVRAWVTCRDRDHPRSRGEYCRSREALTTALGSSPLSRGIPGRKRMLEVMSGIIPALAGNTLRPGGFDRYPRDHPRSRGEYGAGLYGSGRVSGSSPLSRGIRTDAPHNAEHVGIIPALAGNTEAAAATPPRRPDHPRSRGEYSCLNRCSCSMSGSSPLSRGIRRPARHRATARRIIPALAGNTVSSGRPSAHFSDHPRSRGEYQPSVSGQLGGNGSSPLSRGIL